MSMKRALARLLLLICAAGLATPAVGSQDDLNLGFEDAFVRPFYTTSSFGFVVTGTAVVAAGAFSYFTAGAGAPVAATGVSTVASWVGGGGAGSYRRSWSRSAEAQEGGRDGWITAPRCGSRDPLGAFTGA